MERIYQSYLERIAQYDKMTSITSVVTRNKFKRRDIFISILLALYILLMYTPKITAAEVIGSAVLYAFLGLSIFKTIAYQTPLKITPYSIWYLAFGILGSLSIFYARNDKYVFDDLYVLFVSLTLTFSFIQYIRSSLYIVRIFSYFAYLPILFLIYLFLSGRIIAPDERLGQSLFGNANILAGNLMISLFCIGWYIVYAKRKYLLMNILLALVSLYTTALTGGRKFLLIPFIFLLLILLFEFWREKKPSSILSIIFFVLIIFIAVWAVINIPALYNSIGIRFEGLLSFINGNTHKSDASTVYRFMMIHAGWNWFLDKPVLGHGLNNFQGLFSEILYETSYAHNNYIELMVDLGIVGILVYYSFYVYIFVKLVKIRNDATGIRNFFLAFMLALLIFEIGAVTYKLYIIQIFIGLASAYVWLHDKNGSKE